MVTCSRCGEEGHNKRKRSCPGRKDASDTESPQPAPKKAKKSKPKSPSVQSGDDEADEEDVGDDDEQHCVRCHANFPPSEIKSKRACVVLHYFNSEDWTHGWRNKHGKTFVYESICCGKKGVAIELSGDGDWWDMKKTTKCFIGAHTTNSKEVKYNGTSHRPCKLDEDGNCRREHFKVEKDPRKDFPVMFDQLSDQFDSDEEG